MLNGVNLSLVTFARAFGLIDGHVVVFLAMALAATEAAVGLAIVIAIFRLKKTVNADDMALMKG
jgi:NADH-quinone oxidoreductase subunit K